MKCANVVEALLSFGIILMATLQDEGNAFRIGGATDENVSQKSVDNHIKT